MSQVNKKINRTDYYVKPIISRYLGYNGKNKVDRSNSDSNNITKKIDN